MDFELGALCEPLAVAVHGLRLVDIRFGDRVTVLGAGTIGLMAIAAAKAMGATYIAATARHPHQKAMAEALGADAVFGDDPGSIQQLSKDTRGTDIVVETVGGQANTLQDALTVVGLGGRISVLGAFTKPVQIHPITFFMKEPKIVGFELLRAAGAGVGLRDGDRDHAAERGVAAAVHHAPVPAVGCHAGVRDGGGQVVGGDQGADRARGVGSGGDIQWASRSPCCVRARRPRQNADVADCRCHDIRRG